MLNSLLAILNSRQGMREMYESYDSVRMRPMRSSFGGDYASNPHSSAYLSDNKVGFLAFNLLNHRIPQCNLGAH